MEGYSGDSSALPRTSWTSCTPNTRAAEDPFPSKLAHRTTLWGRSSTSKPPLASSVVMGGHYLTPFIFFIYRLAVNRVHRLFVVDNKNMPIGVVSLRDVLLEVLAKWSPLKKERRVSEGGGLLLEISFWTAGNTAFGALLGVECYGSMLECR